MQLLPLLLINRILSSQHILNPLLSFALAEAPFPAIGDPKLILITNPASHRLLDNSFRCALASDFKLAPMARSLRANTTLMLVAGNLALLIIKNPDDNLYVLGTLSLATCDINWELTHLMEHRYYPQGADLGTLIAFSLPLDHQAGGTCWGAHCPCPA